MAVRVAASYGRADGGRRLQDEKKTPLTAFPQVRGVLKLWSLGDSNS